MATPLQLAQVDLGYAGVELLYAAGAECCMHYRDNDIHHRCPWHNEFLADHKIRSFRMRHHESLKPNQIMPGCDCAYCAAMTRVLECHEAITVLKNGEAE